MEMTFGDALDQLNALVISGSLNKLLISTWLIMMIGANLVGLVPTLSMIGNHGKLHSPITDPLDRMFYLSKARFLDFYILGLVWTCMLMVLVQSFPLGGLLFAVHNARRIYECLNITFYCSSQMHIGGYAAGLVHYVLAPLTIVSASFEVRDNKFLVNSILVFVFILSNVGQYHSHNTLYLLKLSNGHRYQLPTGGLFDLCVCPHYLCEIVIYVVLSIMYLSPMTLAMVAWVICNLSVVGYKQYSWYVDHCFDDLKRKKPNIIFPFVW